MPDPFDSYSGRLDEALDAAQKKADDASQEAEGSGGPFDSFAGRLDKALQGADGQAVEEAASPVAEAPATATRAGVKVPRELGSVVTRQRGKR